MRASTSAWQFAHRSAHLSASAHSSAQDRVVPFRLIANLFDSASTWWNCSPVVSVVAAQFASAARPFDKPSLHSSPPVAYRGHPALATAVPTFRAHHEDPLPVLRADARHAKPAVGSCAFLVAATPDRFGLQVKALEPMTDGRVPDAQFSRSFTNRRAVLDQPTQSLGVHLPVR